MIKVIKNGKVAVLVSPGFGAGWSTWTNEDPETLIFDHRIVTLVECRKTHKITDEFMKKEFGIDMYCGGAKDLEIEWIDKGTQFRIEEYDGSESIHVIGSCDYFTA